MKVLLIGGSGTLSSDTTRLCIVRGYEVYLLNRGNRNIFKGENLHYLIGDINNMETAQKVLAEKKFDVVIDYLTFDVDQLKKRIEIFNDRCKQYIFISSATVFQNTDKVIDETFPKGGTGWPYAQNKLECEKYLEKNRNNLGFYYTIVRPYITYDDRRVPFPVITKKFYWSVIDRIDKDKPILMCDRGEAKLTLTHTMDFAVGITGLFLNDMAKNEDFNVVGDTVGTWNDILHIIEEFRGKKAKIVYVPTDRLAAAFRSQSVELRCDKSHSHVFDNSKIKEAVPEFKTSWNLHDGLNHTLSYLNSDGSLQKVDQYWDNTQDVLCAKFDHSYRATARQKLIYLLQENKYLRIIGRAGRKLGFWDF